MATFELEITGQRLPFEWLGGHPALDFVNTVSWHPEGLREERLRTYDDLLSWLVEGALAVETAPIRAAARERPGEADAALERALELRHAIHALGTARAYGEPFPSEALSRLQRALAVALAAIGLDDDGRWVWRGRPEALERAWWPIAWEAARLFAEPPAAPLRRCANPVCGWLFLDQSRRGNRRWCEMATCGNRDKARRFYARRRGAE